MAISTVPYVYKLTWVGTILGQQNLNIFYYGSVAPLVSIHDILVAQKELVWNATRLIQSVQCTLDQVKLEGVKGTNVFGAVTIGEQGSVSGDCLPPYAAYGFTLVRAGVGERNGYKRFAGVPESYQSNGIGVGSVEANVPTIEAALTTEPVTEDDTLIPLVRRTRVHKVIQNPPTYWTVGSALYEGITTQNSRKFGHGA